MNTPLFHLLVHWPMLYLYQFGIWRGLNSSDICAALTNYDSRFWAAARGDCSVIIDRQVRNASGFAVHANGHTT